PRARLARGLGRDDAGPQQGNALLVQAVRRAVRPDPRGRRGRARRRASPGAPARAPHVRCPAPPAPVTTLSTGPEPAPRVLEFSPATHEYRVDGALVPSVTQLLDDAGLTPDYSVVPPNVLQHARERGIHIDLACDLLDADDLDWRSVHPEAFPYVE